MIWSMWWSYLRLSPTKDFVSHLVAIQLAYINSKHPEFAADAAMINVLQENSASPFHSNAATTITEVCILLFSSA